MSGLFSVVNILADITGPGTVGLFGDDQCFVVVSGRFSVVEDMCNSCVWYLSNVCNINTSP